MTFEELTKLMAENRSTRRFDASRPICRQTIADIVGLVSLCASGRNIQPIKYRIVTSREECDAIFPALKWAGYYTDWNGPAGHERPVSYLIQCLDTDICKPQALLCDDGIQLEAITLGARAKGIAGCIIKAFNAATVSSALNIPEKLMPMYVIALGYPAEKIELVAMDEHSQDAHKYYRRADGTHCVPKRAVESIIIG